MAEYLINDTTLEDIADSIRAKDGTSADIQVSDYAQRIQDIPSGSDTLKDLMTNNIYTYTIPNDVTTIKNYLFYRNTNLESIDLNDVTNIQSNAFEETSISSISSNNVITFGGSAFNVCRSLIKANFPYCTSGAFNLFRECSYLKYVNFASLTSMGSGGLFANCNRIIWVDLGTSNISQNTVTSSLERLILRKTSAQPLSNSSYVNGLFNSTGGKIYRPSGVDYSTETNWSSKTFTQIDIVGSRFENKEWLASLNSQCILDGNTIDVLDNETVAIFKHTENISHCYENGVELQDTDLVKGKTLTSTI